MEHDKPAQSRSVLEPEGPVAPLESREVLRAQVRLYEDLATLSSRRDMLQVTLNYLVQVGYLGAVGLLHQEGAEELIPARTSFRVSAEARLVVPHARNALPLSLKENLCVQALERRAVVVGGRVEALLGPSLGGEQARLLHERLQITQVAAVPLWIQERPYAVLALWTDQGRAPLEVEALERMRELVQGALARAQLIYELALERQRYASARRAWMELFGGAVDPVFLVDPMDGRFMRFNAAACAFLGYEEGELGALSLLDVKIGDGPDSGALLIYRTLEQRQVRVEEAAFRRKDGRVAFARLSARHLKVQLDFVGPTSDQGLILLMVRDVTEHRVARSAIQKAYDQLSAYVEDLKRKNEEVARERSRVEEANRLKSEFLANMSHELRTPMNAIIGFTTRVLKTAEERLTAKEQRNLNIVLRNADQLLVMINGLLDFSKLEANRVELQPEVFEVYDLLEEAMEITAQLLKGRQIELKIDCPTGLTLETDRGKLRQILLNLLSNAARFTEAGEIEVKARQTLDAQRLPVVEIQVRDTGIGIRQDHLEMIFDAFRQVDGSYTRKEGGTGLGLAISSKLAGLLGGRISVESVFGEGSTFTFTCPTEPPRRRVGRAERAGT
jgi:PAS domain S-box-containing protein